MQQEPHTSARYGPNAILAAGMARPSASTPIAPSNTTFFFW